MNKDEALKRVTENGWDLYELSDDLKKDIEIVTAAVNSEPGSIEYADESLRDNKELMTLAIIKSENGMIMKYASDNLKKDKQFVLDMLIKTKDNYVLSNADESLQEDAELQAQAQKNLG